MARKQVGLKLEEEDLARWDAWASSRGYSRTTLIETAVERLIGADEKQAPESQVPEGKSAPRAKLDTYPSAPTDSKERREYFAWRNEQIQKLGQAGRR